METSELKKFVHPDWLGDPEAEAQGRAIRQVCCVQQEIKPPQNPEGGRINMQLLPEGARWKRCIDLDNPVLVDVSLSISYLMARQAHQLEVRIRKAREALEGILDSALRIPSLPAVLVNGLQDAHRHLDLTELQPQPPAEADNDAGS